MKTKQSSTVTEIFLDRVQMTNKKGPVTLAGKRQMRPYGKWGMNKGEYAYVFTAVTADMLLPADAVQYIIDVRISSRSENNLELTSF